MVTRSGLTTTEELAKENLAIGGIDQPLKTQVGVEVAGLGSKLHELFDMARSVTSTKAHTPTPRQESLDPRLLSPGEHKRQRLEKSEAVLSSAGQERFKAAGGVLPTDSASDTIEVAKDALSELPSEAISLAKQAQRQEAKGAKPRDPDAKTIMDEDKTAEILDAHARAKQAIIDGAEGTDINFDNIQSTEDVFALFNAVSEVDASRIADVKRGIVTHAETKLEAERALLADELGVTRSILNRNIGDTFNAEQLYAARVVMVRSAEKGMELRRQIIEMEKGGNVDSRLLLDFRRQLAIHSGLQMQFKGAVTEIARSLSASRIPAGAEIDLNVGEISKEMLHGLGGPGDTIRIAKNLGTSMAKLGNQNPRLAVHNLADGRLTKLNRVYQEVLINGMLSHTKTHFKNLFGTPVFAMYNATVDILAAAIGTGIRAGQRATGQEISGEGVYFSDTVLRMYGYAAGLGDAWEIAYDVFKKEAPMDTMSKAEQNQYQSIASSYLDVHGNWGKSVDILGKIIRLPGRALMTVDEFWKGLSDAGERHVLAAQEYHKARAAGKSHEFATDNALMVQLNPRVIKSELDAQARLHTLTTPFEHWGPMVQKFGEAFAEVQKNPVGRMIFPFMNVPTNDVLRVLESSPLSPVMKTNRNNLSGRNGPVAQQRAIAKVALGSTSLYLAYEYGVNGRSTGGYPTDSKQRKMLPPNWKPYSAVFREGDWKKSGLVDEDGDPLQIYNRETGLPNGPLTYVNIAGFGPVSGLFVIGADISERMRRTEDPDQQTALVSNGVASMFNYFEQLPFLMGVSSIMKAIRHDDVSYMVNSPLGNMIPGTVFPAPYSATFRNVANMMDPTSRTPSMRHELYTIDDVERLAKEAGEDPDYRRVGLPKGIMSGDASWLEGSLNYYWQLQLKASAAAKAMGHDTEELAINYDVLGRPKEKGVRFDINPIMAIHNLISPFTITKGRAPSDLEKELKRVGMPLGFKRTSIVAGNKAVRLSNKQASDWVNLAKNVVTLSRDETRGSVQSGEKRRRKKGRFATGATFREALEILLESSWYTGSTRDAKYKLIRSLEGRYYEKAKDALLDMPENENLLVVLTDLKTLDKGY